MAPSSMSSVTAGGALRRQAVLERGHAIILPTAQMGTLQQQSCASHVEWEHRMVDGDFIDFISYIFKGV